MKDYNPNIAPILDVNTAESFKRTTDFLDYLYQKEKKEKENKSNK